LLHNEVRGLKEELDKLKEKLAQKEKELKSRQAAVLADGKKEKSSSAPFPWVDLAIALLGYAAAALILSQWPRYVVIPKKITKKRLGQKHVFTFHSWIDGEAFYKCPSCTECRLMEKNLDRHLDRCQGAQTPDNTQTQKVNAA
jgi:hypothetical protein